MNFVWQVSGIVEADGVEQMVLCGVYSTHEKALEAAKLGQAITRWPVDVDQQDVWSFWMSSPAAPLEVEIEVKPQPFSK